MRTKNHYLQDIAELKTLDDIEGWKIGRDVYAEIHGEDLRWREGELTALLEREREIRRKGAVESRSGPHSPNSGRR